MKVETVVEMIKQGTHINAAAPHAERTRAILQLEFTQPKTARLIIPNIYKRTQIEIFELVSRPPSNVMRAKAYLPEGCTFQQGRDVIMQSAGSITRFIDRVGPQCTIHMGIPEARVNEVRNFIRGMDGICLLWEIPPSGIQPPAVTEEADTPIMVRKVVQ